MRIFQLSKKMPYPPLDGESVGLFTYTRAFALLGNKVVVLSMNTPKHNFSPDSIPPDVRRLADFDAVFVNTALSPLKAFLNLFSDKSYNIERFVSKDFEKRLIAHLQKNKFDIIELASSYLVPYIPIIRQYSNAPITVRLQNVENIIWARLAAEQSFWPKKRYLQLLAARMKRFEFAIPEQCDALLPVSVVDEAYFRDEIGCKKPLFLLPYCLDVSQYKAWAGKPANDNKEANEASLYYLGALDWTANTQGLEWFLRQVWPLVQQKCPNLKFYIAGRKMNEEHRRYYANFPNVQPIGEVADAEIYHHSQDVMVVPLLAGSGMRVKIIEAMAWGKPIVATSIAAEGIEYENGRDIQIADTPENFANAVVRLVSSPNLCRTMGANARRFVEKKHDVMAVTQQLLDFYQQLAANKEQTALS